MPQIFFSEEQIDYRRGKSGTNNQLYTDKHILKEAKTTRKNVTIALFDFQKAFDMVLRNWMTEILKYERNIR